MKKEKESLDSQLRSMGINPPPGPAYIPTPAEMRPGPSLSFIGQDNMLSIRDRSLTTESFAGDLSEGMFVSTKDGPKTKPTVRIRSSSESEGTENKANSQQSTKVSFEFEFVVSRDKPWKFFDYAVSLKSQLIMISFMIQFVLNLVFCSRILETGGHQRPHQNWKESKRRLRRAIRGRVRLARPQKMNPARKKRL